MKEKKHLISIGDKAFKALQKVKYRGIVNDKRATTWQTASDLILIGAGKLDPESLNKEI